MYIHTFTHAHPYAYKHTHTSIYTYIFLTTCRPLKHQRVMSGYRRTHGLQTYVRRPWLIVSVNLGYSFNVHA